MFWLKSPADGAARLDIDGGRQVRLEPWETAMNAITIIQDEHRRMGAVLTCLTQLSRELLDPEVQPDLAPFEAILAYLEAFPARFHHPKEETYLFRALDARAPDLKPVLDTLRDEHDQGERRLVDLERALERLRTRPTEEAGNFCKAVDDYVAFEKAHIRLEETEILPQAASRLTAEELAVLEDAFLGNEDPLFSAGRQRKYRDLYSYVLAAVPQPHGFADPWKRQAAPLRA
ncbi:hypothetical protein CVT23_07180 [Minwuia thermotolerans]|uniref:Hemerythrin-like domain-containing protein n=2 Tax=Minwuia thermotolerans TaxID=2056226 RepID=A0A2M9G3C0_9PROT|nr:hypothetical protein CVT23_07180 [Minwuia thermotolerans]